MQKIRNGTPAIHEPPSLSKKIVRKNCQLADELKNISRRFFLRQCLVLVCVVVVLAVVGCVKKSEMESWSSALPFQVKNLCAKIFNSLTD